MSGAVHVLIPKRGATLGAGYTQRERFEGDWEHPGRRTDGRQSAATFVLDCADRRKVILLCSWCRPHFNPRAHRYRRMYIPDMSGRTDGYVANGKCFACKQQTALSPGGGTAYISEETYAQVCQDPADARRRARQTWRTGTSVWAAVQSNIRRAWGSRAPSEGPARSAR